MSETTYPNVLIISDCDFHHGTDATAITVRNIFSGWPVDNLSFIQLKSYHAGEIIENNKFVLDSRNLQFGQFLTKVRRQSGNLTDAPPVLITETNVNKITKFKQNLRLSISSSADMLNYQLNNQLSEFIKKHNPDIIYLLPYGRRIINLALNIQRQFGIPVLPHFMDDWPSTIYNNSFLSSVQRKLTLKTLKTLFDHCEKALVISDAMKNEFERRYKKCEFFSLMNDVEEYIGSDIDEDRYEEKISLCYAGGLHLNRWASLLELCKIVSNNKNIKEIAVYTNPNDWKSTEHYFKEYPFVAYKGFIKQKDVLKSLSHYDALIFIESFDDNIKEYTRFSISTKIPEYLSLGKSIIAVGPSDIASIIYLKENNIAIVCDDTNRSEWNNILENSFKNKELLKKNIENGKIIFFKNHYRKNQRQKLLEVLYSLKK
ncbi:hypothetical protein DRF65_07765 [Chryseobacterium pennae]|uniref:Glycosyltransferase subfamily 4-like N-terminal domain-containing protein n=1 Tax=Chryseobacterium pennae TaxID=2258962 RepID=A0A3D9CC58_9FLAO|nr:hypothetical protein [Chryseobacterium pennae]REC63111.1 hypothetical protein DRF65_07765 [Chryseobacterium pennae]